MAASQLAFLLMRRAGRPWAERLASPETLDRFDSLVERHGAFFLAFSFMVPFMPGDMLNLAAGVSAIPARRFLAINVLGRLPGVALSTLVGAYGLTLGPEAWLAIIAALASVLAIWLWRGGWQQLAELRGCPPALAQ